MRSPTKWANLNATPPGTGFRLRVDVSPAKAAGRYGHRAFTDMRLGEVCPRAAGLRRRDAEGEAHCSRRNAPRGTKTDNGEQAAGRTDPCLDDWSRDTPNGLPAGCPSQRRPASLAPTQLLPRGLEVNPGALRSRHPLPRVRHSYVTHPGHRDQRRRLGRDRWASRSR